MQTPQCSESKPAVTTGSAAQSLEFATFGVRIRVCRRFAELPRRLWVPAAGSQLVHLQLWWGFWRRSCSRRRDSELHLKRNASSKGLRGCARACSIREHSKRLAVVAVSEHLPKETNILFARRPAHRQVPTPATRDNCFSQPWLSRFGLQRARTELHAEGADIETMGSRTKAGKEPGVESAVEGPFMCTKKRIPSM